MAFAKAQSEINTKAMKEKLILQVTLIIVTMGAYLIAVAKNNISRNFELGRVKIL